MKRTLLLADDSATIQRVVQLIFADEGFSVIAVGDGERAIEHLAGTRPDIVLADVSMPKLTGYDIGAHIKATPHLAGIPLVLLTGAFERLDETRARAAGYSGVVSKPIDPEGMISLVRDLLENKLVPPTPESRRESAPTPTVERSTPAGEYLEELDRRFVDAGYLPRQPESLVPAPEPFDAAQGTPSGNRGALKRPPKLEVTDELVDEVSRRVLEKLSKQVVHEIVTARVLNLAERLVREEIDRLRASSSSQ
jgi:CheY-like chemotaxis protein